MLTQRIITITVKLREEIFCKWGLESSPNMVKQNLLKRDFVYNLSRISKYVDRDRIEYSLWLENLMIIKYPRFTSFSFEGRQVDFTV